MDSFTPSCTSSKTETVVGPPIVADAPTDVACMVVCDLAVMHVDHERVPDTAAARGRVAHDAARQHVHVTRVAKPPRPKARRC